MSSPFHTIDYAHTCFEYPTLSKIHGSPSFNTLNTLKKQLKANAQSISCNLGGGAHGHLGLVLTPTEYRSVSDTPYEIPDFPGQLTLPRNADAVDAVRRRDVHFEKIRLFREVTDVRKALIRQIVASIDGNYLDELRDDNTNTISSTIPEILQYLFDNFADVTPQDVTKAEEKLNELHWNITDPPMVFLAPIEELQKLATAAKIPRTAAQLISIGLSIVQRTGDFEKALLEWFERNEDEKTWVNFKLHFTAAHKALRRVRGKTIRDTSYFQANQMVEQVNNNINQLKTDILDSMSTLRGHHQDSSTYSSPTLPTLASSVTTPSKVSNEDLLLLIQDLQRQLNTKSQASTTKPPSKRIVTHYCWTHGACGHPSSACRNKKQGHKDDATFQNKLGGSVYYCKVAADQRDQNSNT